MRKIFFFWIFLMFDQYSNTRWTTTQLKIGDCWYARASVLWLRSMHRYQIRRVVSLVAEVQQKEDASAHPRSFENRRKDALEIS